MKLLFLPVLFFATYMYGQSECPELIGLIGERDISEAVQTFRKNCGPFVENISVDGKTKTYSSEEKGITIAFINRAKDAFALAKYEVLTVELTSFTKKGGYKEVFPLGFKLGMDYKMVKNHILQLDNISYEKKDMGKKNSSFVYTGVTNATAKGRNIKFSIIQFDGKTISSMRLRLK